MLCRWARRVLGGAPRAQIGIAEIIAAATRRSFRLSVMVEISCACAEK
jgi:hypothetical protein